MIFAREPLRHNGSPAQISWLFDLTDSRKRSQSCLVAEARAPERSVQHFHPFGTSLQLRDGSDDVYGFARSRETSPASQSA